MSGLKMPRRGEAARLLSELNAEHAPAPSDDDKESQSYDQSYGNMTGQKDSNTVVREENKPEIQQAIQADVPQAGQLYGQPSLLVGSQPASPSAVSSASVRDAIRAQVQRGRQKEILKTVTIKLSPELDQRVERHCYEAGRLKQEVIRDALLLYFEILEEGQTSTGGED